MLAVSPQRTRRVNTACPELKRDAIQHLNSDVIRASEDDNFLPPLPQPHHLLHSPSLL